MSTKQQDELLKNNSTKLVKLGEAVVTCPICGSKSLRITDYLYDLPLVGKIILTTGKCEKCGYKYNDVRLAEAKPPQRIILKVEDEDDLNALVVRASSASIIIPEKGLEMHPGPASQGFITTVEGLLERFREAIELACKDPEASKEKCNELLEWIKRAKEGQEDFTVIIEDPEGVSTIVSPKARTEPLNEKRRD
ncbi:ZPR1 zinc finger domain-containing protein [Pyrofollis japonicus]|uniref:ZPR1 zinc finger domain-containing protein n=1 Tax=Pyrofollis japonicus TaxID=3060460 RepID=UPI00295BA2F2|nr:ZPR1 zinc finger domain-containing protein [Pyrofollis japonicus]